MSEGWLKKMWSLALRWKSVDAMNAGKPFTRCGTLMVYTGELKLIPDSFPIQNLPNAPRRPIQIESSISGRLNACQ